MAGTRGVVHTTNALAVIASAKTMLQIAPPTNIAIVVPEIHVSFDGTTSNAAKVLVELVRSATGGTGTSLTSGDAPQKINGGDPESLQSTAKENFSAEPSGGIVIARRWVHPQADYTFRPRCKLKGGSPGDTLGIRCTCSTAVNVRASIEFEE
jgi:hypothetical protein